MKFWYLDEPLETLDHPYNQTRLNERQIEVPIARDFIERHAGYGLEVGNVLRHYGPVGHVVVDRYEEGDHLQTDIFDITGPTDWVISISTLEHVRADEPSVPNPYGGVAAFHYLRGLADHGLVTIPVGYNPKLDTAIAHSTLDVSVETTYTCTQGVWTITDFSRRPYRPDTREGGAVWVGEW